VGTLDRSKVATEPGVSFIAFPKGVTLARVLENSETPSVVVA